MQYNPKTGRDRLRSNLLEWTSRSPLTFRQSHAKKRACNLLWSECRCEATAMICSDVLFRSTSARADAAGDCMCQLAVGQEIENS